jgi:uncharacterized protein (DUF58 family)
MSNEVHPGGPRAIRPSPFLVRLIVVATAGAVIGLVLPIMIGPTLFFLAIGLAVAILDWLTSRDDRPPRIERDLPARAIRGRATTVTYRLSQPDGAATRVSILDELPAELGGDLTIEDTPLRRYQQTAVSRDLIPQRRGTFALGPTYVLWRSRFGFFRLRASLSFGGSVVILPPASRPERRAGLTHVSVKDELGIRPRPSRGEGAEFESLRVYVPGDDPRHVDWRASARHDKLIVRNYRTERRHTIMIAIDSGRLMSSRVEGVSKFDHAIDCAIALARASKEYGDRVGLLVFDRELRVFSAPKPGASGIAGIVQATLNISSSPHEPSYRVLTETLAQRQKKRALIVVLTDFVEGGAARELESYMTVLARRHCLLLVAMRDRLMAEVDVREPDITRDRLYRRLALLDLVVEREAALARIARFGAQTLDLDPSRINAPVLNRYLAIRQAEIV